jgi:hypothetical protein
VRFGWAILGAELPDELFAEFPAESPPELLTRRGRVFDADDDAPVLTVCFVADVCGSAEGFKAADLREACVEFPIRCPAGFAGAADELLAGPAEPFEG